MRETSMRDMPICAMLNSSDPNETVRATEHRWVLAVLVLAIGALAYPAPGGAFLINPESAQYTSGYAFRNFAAQSLRDGFGFPQWNSYMFGGMPYVAALHGDIFYPTFLLRLILPTDIAATWSVILHCVLAGLFMFRFLRATGLQLFAALFGALAYMLSGPLVSVGASGRDSVLFAATMLPLSLWMLTRAIRDEYLWAWGVFALSVGLISLTANFAALQALLATSVAFAILHIRFAAQRETDATRVDQIGSVLTSEYRDVAGTTEQRIERELAGNHARSVVIRIAIVVGAILLGLLIGSVQSWPALAYESVSTAAAHAGDSAAARVLAARTHAVPPEDLLNAYLPQFSGIQIRYWGRSADRLQSVYAGVAVLIFALLGTGFARKKSQARLWLAILTVACVWMVSPFTPLHALLNSIAPTLALFRDPGAATSVAAFALSVLASFGLQRVLEHQLSTAAFARSAFAWIAFSGVIVLLAVSGALNVIAHEITRDGSLLNQFGNSFIPQRIESNTYAQLLGTFRSGAVVVGVLLATLLFTRRAIAVPLFAAIVIAINVTDQWSIARLYWKFSKPASQLFEGDAITSYLRQQKEPGRVFVHSTSADYRTVTDPYFGTTGFGNGGGLMVHDIAAVTGLHDNPIARYARLVGSGTTVDSTWWQHENVRWVYSSTEIVDSLFRNVVANAHNSANSRVFLYEVPGHHSYAWVASSFGTRGDSAALREILRASYNPRTFVSVDSGAVVNGNAVPPAPALFFEPNSTVATVTDFGPGRATIQLSAPSIDGNALVVSENFYNGWRAESNGQALPLLRASFNLVGVVLPAGTTSVSLSFQDPRYVTGRAITLVALLLTGSLILWGSRRRRTTTPSAGEYRTTHDDAASIHAH